MAARTLLIMRHADAEPGRPGLPDVQRQLTDSGHDRARAQATVIVGHPPDVVLCSAATRATQTLSHLDTAAAEIHVERSLYEASPTSLLLRLAELDTDVGTVWVVGHMPTVGQLSAGLMAGMPVEDFSPGTVVVVDVPDAWADLRPRSAVLRHLFA